MIKKFLRFQNGSVLKFQKIVNSVLLPVFYQHFAKGKRRKRYK